MKTLVIVRHAKSSWDNPGLSDFERTLNKRGLRDAPFMAEKVSEKNIKPDIILSSPAVRAYTTATFYAKALEIPVENINRRELIYDRGAKQILMMLNEIDDDINTAMLFGHNPDLSTLSHFLCNFTAGNLPTCGTVCIDFDIDSWSNLGDDEGNLRFFESPKMYFKKQ